jgi:predicted nucleotidyltransferase
LFTLVELEDLLAERLGVKVDLVEKDELKPYIGRRVLAEVQYL